MMRQEFVECKDRRTAVRRCPWACKIVRVEGGFRAFVSVYDWWVWMDQGGEQDA